LSKEFAEYYRVLGVAQPLARTPKPPPRAPEEGQARKKAKFHGSVAKARFQTPEEESRWWFPDPEESQVASPASPMQEESPSSSTTPARSKPYEL